LTARIRQSLKTASVAAVRWSKSSGDRHGDFAVLLCADQESLPCSLETLPCGSGEWVGGATGLQAPQKTRQEQGKHREAERFFKYHFHLAGKTAHDIMALSVHLVLGGSLFFFEAEPSGIRGESRP